MGQILADLITIYIIVLAARAILSWFPVQHGSFLATVNRLLIDLTEPVLRPFRRIIPPAGIFDLSFIVVFLLLVILRGALAGS